MRRKDKKKTAYTRSKGIGGVKKYRRNGNFT